MAENRYSSMSDEELKEIAKKKVKRTGYFKRSAIKAQEELWRRYRWTNNKDLYIDGEVIDRDIVDVQYNG